MRTANIKYSTNFQRPAMKILRDAMNKKIEFDVNTWIDKYLKTISPKSGENSGNGTNAATSPTSPNNKENPPGVNDGSENSSVSSSCTNSNNCSRSSSAKDPPKLMYQFGGDSVDSNDSNQPESNEKLLPPATAPLPRKTPIHESRHLIKENISSNKSLTLPAKKSSLEIDVPTIRVHKISESESTQSFIQASANVDWHPAGPNIENASQKPFWKWGLSLIKTINVSTQNLFNSKENKENAEELTVVPQIPNSISSDQIFQRKPQVCEESFVIRVVEMLEQCLPLFNEWNEHKRYCLLSFDLDYSVTVIIAIDHKVWHLNSAIS